MPDTSSANKPLPIVGENDYTIVTEGAQKDIPEYWGNGSSVKVATRDDLLIVDVYDPGYGTHWVGRLDAVTQRDQRIAALTERVERLRRAYLECEARAYPGGDTSHRRECHGLHDGDLDPPGS